MLAFRAFQYGSTSRPMATPVSQQTIVRPPLPNSVQCKRSMGYGFVSMPTTPEFTAYLSGLNSANKFPQYKHIKMQKQDPMIYNILQKETQRQKTNLELIASENFTSAAVLEANGSLFTNKYSEGQIGKRYYGGAEYIDELETECKKRALKLYGLDPEKWGVNVQALSGSPANMAVYTGLLNPGDRIMGMSLPSGGHISHAGILNGKKISASAIYFQGSHYEVNPETGLLDYDDIQKRVSEFKPHLLLIGGSAYTRDYDYGRMREIADSVGAILHSDMAHISGLVATKEANSPFDHCDVVTTTTHKTLRGPRSALIFAKKELIERIDFAVFPLLQGGPHNHQIAAVAVALGEAMRPEFREYIRQVKTNAVVLSETLQKLGYEIVTGGTDNHIVLVNVRAAGITGSKVEKLLEHVNISVNKNTIPGDTSAMNPGGIRLGTPAMTTRGLKEEDFVKVAMFIDRAIKIGLEIQKTSGKMLKDFVANMNNKELDDLKKEITEYCEGFPLPGFDK